MGFVKDQQGIISRFENEYENWISHFNNSKTYIFNNCIPNSNSSVYILGSGWLLDVPIDYLSKSFKQVYLYDIYHPKKIVRFIEKFKNVTCVQNDLAFGLIEFLYDFRFVKNQIPDKTIIENFINNSNYEFEENAVVVSLNLLSQLSLLIKEYIYQDINNVFSDFDICIQEKHVLELKKYNSILITDYEEHNFNKKNELINKDILIKNMNLLIGNNTEIWDWIFDTHQTYNSYSHTLMKVMALKLK